MFKISQQILSLPFLLNEVYVVIGLLLVSDVLHACLFSLLSHFIFHPDTLLLLVTILPHFSQLIFIPDLLQGCLSLKGLESRALFDGISCFTHGNGVPPSTLVSELRLVKPCFSLV